VTRALSVTATPLATELEPGTSTSVTVGVVDGTGNPVSDAHVAIVVVDEAVLALTGYEIADPLDVFYQAIDDYLQAQYARAGIQLSRSDLVKLVAEGEESGSPTLAEGSTDYATDDSAGVSGEMADGDMNRSGSDGAPIDVRSNFDALAVWAPDGTTNADGSVTVDFDVPDNLTRYRVMAVAVSGTDRFGKGESNITARLPLMVRPSAPRFLNFGDQFELPVVLQNQTDAELVVDVAVETDNLALTGDIGKRVTVPANDRVEVRFPATTVEVGTARFRVAAASGDFADASEGELPVYTPATAEAFATYGVLDGPAIANQPTATPTGVFPQFGGLEINTSATALQSLTDAVIYLNDYPYQSADGYASRLMAVASLRDVLDAFDADGLPSADELDAAVAADIDGLQALQNDDGGFPYWQRGRLSVPWVSIQSVHALVLAQQAGYTVTQSVIDRGLGHLAEIEQYIPADYDDMSRNTLRAYAIYVRGVAGDVDTAKATSLYSDERDVLQVDAVAWLWPSITDPVLLAEIEQSMLNRAVDTAGAVSFATDYTEDAYVIAQSSRRTDGIVLDALITQIPGSELIPKTVAGLMAGQSPAGHWNNVHENAFILIALDRYFETFESVTPEFIARVWLGDLYVSEHGFSGYSTDRAHTLLPMSDLITNTAAAGGTSNITVQNDGVGRLYYRLGLRYAPDDLTLDARDEGFVVERLYEGVDDPDDVTHNADGTWNIRAGAKVRVTLTMVADAQRTHVALVDALPAGLEPLNPALEVAQTIPPEENEQDGDVPYRRGWGWNWFDHQNLRDDRVEAFATYLPGGTYEYSYIARATTPGTFVVPPARAEEIYAPETFGRSASTTVVVA
ncbi:MAG TPA: alpha-2-macroglobulin family protein, partial [Ilumatobacter sp.]|nr:alpha-2-macroglobulin family protein [Ilumatobacter sp.]